MMTEGIGRDNQTVLYGVFNSLYYLIQHIMLIEHPGVSITRYYRRRVIIRYIQNDSSY